MVLIAIVILLVGFCVWSFLGELDSKVDGVLIKDQGTINCYISEEDVTKVQPGMTVKCNDEEFTIEEVSRTSIDAQNVLTEYAMHVGEFSNGEWLHAVSLNDNGTELPDGTYDAYIIIESVKPISFILN